MMDIVIWICGIMLGLGAVACLVRVAKGPSRREGEEIEPGLKVEVISPRSAILNHRGSRYNINY